MTTLITKLGRDQVLASLLNRFHELGALGIPGAKESWENLGLDYSTRTATGLCLQSLLEDVDKYVSAHEVSQAHADFVVGNTACTVRLARPHDFHMTLPVSISAK